MESFGEPSLRFYIGGTSLDGRFASFEMDGFGDESFRLLFVFALVTAWEPLNVDLERVRSLMFIHANAGFAFVVSSFEMSPR